MPIPPCSPVNEGSDRFPRYSDRGSSLRDGVAQLLPAAKLRKGVKVCATDDGVAVDLYVVIEFGTNLTEVSHNLANRVRYVLTNMADVKVASVDVHVQGVKVRAAQ